MPEFVVVLLIMLLASLAAIYVIGGADAVQALLDAVIQFFGG